MNKLLTRKRMVLLLLSAIIIAVGICLTLFFKTSEWDNDTRFRFSLMTQNGDVFVCLLNPSKNEVQVAKLNGDVEVEAAHGLGKWKISSLKKLGEIEKIQGDKLTLETLIQGFGAPIEGVIHYSGSSNIQRLTLIRSLLQGRGDILLATRLQIILFVLKAPINVWSEVLEPKNLLTLTREPLNDVSEGIIKVIDKTESKNRYLLKLSAVIENLGGKVLDISEEGRADGNCEVEGKSTFAKKLAKVLDCSYKETSDVQKIVLYSAFLDRF